MWNLNSIIKIYFNSTHVPYRFAEKYYSMSPYQYGANNPVLFIDVNGDSLIVLNNKEGAQGYGHMASIVGNDKNGWTFISKEGRRIDPKTGEKDGTMLFGGESTVLKIEFNTLYEALQDSRIDSYESGLGFETTEKEDKKIVKATLDKAKEDYHVLNNNCADAVSEGLEVLGKNPGTDGAPNGLTGDEGISSVPNKRFKAIENRNKGV